MIAVLYKEFSDAFDIIEIIPGEPLYKSVDCKDRRVIVNGKEENENYIPQKKDVIILRSIPGVAELITLAILTAVVGGIIGIVLGLNSLKKREDAARLLEDRLKNLNRTAVNIPNLRGAKNSISKGQTQPYIIGEHLFTPYFLTAPFTKIAGEDGEDQYYYAVLEAGFNNQVLKTISADDIVLKTFLDNVPQNGTFDLDAGVFYSPSAKIEVVQDGADFLEDEFNKVYQVQSVNAELKKADADDYEDLIYSIPANSASVDVTILFRGLQNYPETGGTGIRTVVIRPYYDVGNGWQEFMFNQNGTPSNTFAKNKAKELRYQATKEFTYNEVKDLDGPILIKLVCETNKADSAMDQVYIQGIKAKLFNPEKSKVAGDFVEERPLETNESALSTRIGIKLKATLSNQDKLDKINVTTSGIVRTWNGSNWSIDKSPTSNVAAWMLEIMTSHTHGPSKVLDSEIDLDAFGLFYEYCDAENINVNKVLMDADEKGNVLESLCRIAGAVLYENIYGEISVAIDAPKANAIAVLNTQNLISFEVSKEIKRETDGLRVSYISSKSGYLQDSYLIMQEGVTRGPDSIIRDIEADGITDFEQVVKYARRLMAGEILRPRQITASVGKEGVYYTPLSKVLVQHPALSKGMGSAEIKKVIVSGANIIGLELYEPIMYDSLYSYGVIVQCVSDTYSTPLPLIYTASKNGRVSKIDLVTPLPLNSPAIPHSGNILSYGLLNGGQFDLITDEMLIAGIEPTDHGFDLSLVDYNEAIYDAGTIPDYIPHVSYTPSPAPAPVGLPPVTLEDVQAGVVVPITTPPNNVALLTVTGLQDKIIMQAVAGGVPSLSNQVASFRYELSRNGGSTWPVSFIAGEQAEYIFDRDIDGYPENLSAYRVRVKAVSPTGSVSASWKTETVGGDYKGWTPGKPLLSGAAGGRNASLVIAKAGNYFGASGFDIQIKKSSEASWYAPGDDSQAYTSETSYKTGSADGYKTILSELFSQALPLENQSLNLPKPKDTKYKYRVRAVVNKPTTVAPTARAVSSWSDELEITAAGTGLKDIIESSIQTKALQPQAVTREKIAAKTITTEELNVLATNKLNSGINASDGITGWAGAGITRFEDAEGFGFEKSAASGAPDFISSLIQIGPKEILEFSGRIQEILRPVENTFYLYTGANGNLKASSWNFTTKKWNIFGNTFNLIGNVTTNHDMKDITFKSYFVGKDVDISDIPAPSSSSTTNLSAIKVLENSFQVCVWSNFFTGPFKFRLYCPSILAVGRGKLTAENILTKDLSAISANVGDITAGKLQSVAKPGELSPSVILNLDTEEFRIGNAPSKEASDTEDAEYLHWKPGIGLFLKLKNLIVDAISSTIRGIFRVRSSTQSIDNSVFIVNPENSADATTGTPANTTRIKHTLSVDLIKMSVPYGEEGIYINNSGDTGIRVYNSGDTSIYINNYGDYGIRVYNTGDTGIYINNSGDTGIRVYNSGDTGIRVYNTGDTGIHVYNSASSGDGIYINNYGDYGLHIKSSRSSASAGIFIENEAISGIEIVSSGDAGIDIYHDDGIGIKIYSDSEGVGLYVYNESGIGIKIDSNTDTGLHVNNDGGIGIYVGNVSGTGITVNNADIGLHVNNDGGIGIYVGNVSGTGITVNNYDDSFAVYITSHGKGSCLALNMEYVVASTEPVAILGGYGSTGVVMPYIYTNDSYNGVISAVTNLYKGSVYEGLIILVRYVEEDDGGSNNVCGIAGYFDNKWCQIARNKIY